MMIRLPYKLLITPDIVPPRKYKRFLSFFEVVVGAPNTINLIVKNIGKEIFPGGGIPGDLIYCENILGMTTFTQERSVTPGKLPTIHPNKTFAISTKKWTPWSPGLWKIRIKIKSKDNTSIKFYQGPNLPPLEGDEWYQFVYAVDRHQLDLTLLLERSLNKKR